MNKEFLSLLLRRTVKGSSKNQKSSKNENRTKMFKNVI